MHARGGRALAALAGLIALLASPGTARATTYSWALPAWRATWSAPRLADDRGFAVAATADAVYTAGVTGSHATGAGHLFLLRYDHEGNRVWEATWGGFELDQAQDVFVDDGGIWVVGSGTTDDAAAKTFAVLLQFDFDGNLVFERKYSKGVVDVLQAVAVHAGSIYVAGFTHPTRLDRNLWAARLDLEKDGDPVWEITRGGSGWDEAWDIAVDDSGVVIAGYETPAGGDMTDALLLLLDHDGDEQFAITWGKPQNDEARAVSLSGDAIYVTGGSQEERSTDVFLARHSRADGGQEWIKTTGGRVTGGGGYGVAVGERGIYVAGGNYDFPAGGDAAILRFSEAGELEWSQILGYPAFWDWGFDVDARDGRFYVAGVLWRPGAEWYEVLTLAYEEDFPTATLERVAGQTASGDLAGARGAMSHFWVGDFLRWAEENGASFEPEPVAPEVPPDSVDPGELPGSPAPPDVDPGGVGAPDPEGHSYVYWEGASGFGKNYGVIWADTERDPVAGEEGGVDAFLGLGDDFATGNYALVRNYTGFRVSLFGGFVRLRYYISHDRLIPQGGYLYVGDVGIAVPPPPV